MHIVLFGDSLTEYGEWPQLMRESWRGHTLSNQGIAGDTAYSARSRVRAVLDEKPDVVFVQMGINDLYMGAPEHEIISSLISIVTQIKGRLPKAQVFLQSMLPTGGPLAHLNSAIVRINAELMIKALPIDVTYVDAWAAMLNGSNELNPAYTTDGVHLSPEGYTTWAGVLATIEIA